MNKILKRLGTIGSCAAMAACTTMQSLTPDASQLRGSLKPGDQLEIATAGGQHLQFKLQSVDETGLHGGGQDINYSDIRSIQRKEISVGRTALLVLGIVAVGAAAGGGGGGGGSGGGY